MRKQSRHVETPEQRSQRLKLLRKMRRGPLELMKNEPQAFSSDKRDTPK